MRKGLFEQFTEDQDSMKFVNLVTNKLNRFGNKVENGILKIREKVFGIFKEKEEDKILPS